MAPNESDQQNSCNDMHLLVCLSFSIFSLFIVWKLYKCWNYWLFVHYLPKDDSNTWIGKLTQKILSSSKVENFQLHHSHLMLRVKRFYYCCTFLFLHLCDIFLKWVIPLMPCLKSILHYGKMQLPKKFRTI